MYMHAHLRYAQALAHVGEAERFFHALCQANPIGLSEIVPTAGPAPIQLLTTRAPTPRSPIGTRRVPSTSACATARSRSDGGWRVYSSGAGILFGLVVRHLFGLRLEAGRAC